MGFLSDLVGSITGANDAKRQADRDRKAAQKAEAERRAALEQGTNQIRMIFDQQFTPAYYENMRKQAMAYYQPQLDRQYQDAIRGLQFQLARQGLTSSSTMANKRGDLQEQNDLARQQISQRTDSMVGERQQQVEAARMNSMNQLYGTEDPSYAGQIAANNALALSRRPEFSPLGAVFENVTGGLAQQAALERAGQSYFNTGWFRPSYSYAPGKGVTKVGG